MSSRTHAAGPGAPGGAEVVGQWEAVTVLPTRHGPFRALGHRDAAGSEYVILTRGLEPTPTAPPLVRIHSGCLTGDALGSLRCDCGDQLAASLEAIDEAGSGVLIYAAGHEGRGIGLLNKLRAYALQDRGLDTVDANEALHLPADARDYRECASILRALGLTRIRLLTSNPAKQDGLGRLGLEVTERVALRVPDRQENAAYLATKRARMGHDPAPPDDWTELLAGRIPAALPSGELVVRYGPLVAAGPRLAIAQLGQSLDGFIATRTGDSAGLTGADDHEHLHRLRALVDAVVVGAGTVTADDCRLTVRLVRGRNPVRVVIDPHGRIPVNSRVLTDGVAPALWLIGPEAEVPTTAAHVGVHRLTAEDFAPVRLLEFLTALGLGRVLVEGGGETVSRFLGARVLDRLFLTSSPLLIGDGRPGIRFDGTDRLAQALHAPTRRFLLGDDVCTEFDLSARDSMPAFGRA